MPKGTVESVLRIQVLAIRLSDMVGVPDRVFSSGEVLFIPMERGEDLAEMTDFDPSKMNHLPFSRFQLDESQFTKLEVRSAVIGAEGRFPLDIPAGLYFVCLADVLRRPTTGPTPGPPYMVAGCDVIGLAKDASLTMKFAQGGFFATLE